MSGERAAAFFTEGEPFAKNLCDLMTEHNENQKKLAEQLGVKQQTISYYRHGQSTPDAENLVKIARHYGVSTDYLLGLSDVKATNTDIKAVYEYTGLHEDTIERLHEVNEKGGNGLLLHAFIRDLVASSRWTTIQFAFEKLIGSIEIAEETNASYLAEDFPFELDRVVEKQSHGFYQIQPIDEQIELCYTRMITELGLLINDITGYKAAIETGRQKWGEWLKIIVDSYEKKARGEQNAKT